MILYIPKQEIKIITPNNTQITGIILGEYFANGRICTTMSVKKPKINNKKIAKRDNNIMVKVSI